MENKNKSHRHKAYFIKPNEQSGESNNAQQPVQASTPNNGEHSNKHKKNKHRRPNTEKPENAIAKENAASNEVSEAPSVKNAQNDQVQKNEKGRRSRHHNSKRSGESKANQTVETSSANTEKSAQINQNSDQENTFSNGDQLEKPAPKKLESFSSSPEFQKYSDYQEFTYEELYGSKEEAILTNPESKSNTVAVEIVDEPNVEVVGIRFKSSGKTYYFAPNGITLRIGTHAIVETARGLEYGEVVMGNTFIPESETVPPLRSVIRAATHEDTLHNEEIKKLEETAFKVCNEKIIDHELDMKLIDAQYTFDNSKLLFYFTSSGRVDFRELVKDLASVFRTRIELRQIGIRDEAKMVGGLGICGRPLCCSIFLTDFGQVSIKMAKEQNLSLNSSKISGICGRLMCCLRYEHDTYEYEIKRTPPVDTLVRTVDGVGTVTEISPLQGTIKVRLAATPEVMPKSYKREEVRILKKKN